MHFLICFYRYCAAGKWLHLFPEGGIWQNKDYSLGGRSNDKVSKIGKLKCLAKA